MATIFGNSDALLKEGWEAQVQEQSQERDALEMLAGTYNETNKAVPDGIMQRVNLNMGEDKRTIPLIMDLQGAGQQGANATLVGFTESPGVRHLTVLTNDVRHGEDLYKFGKHAQRSEWIIKAKDANRRLAKWLKARRGKHKRQALVERYSDNLELSPTSAVTGWNKNIFIPGLTDAQEPTYDSTLATFSGNINTAMSAAGTTSAANLDAGSFAHIEYWASSKWKMEMTGDDYYVLLMHPRTARRMRDMTNSNGLIEKWRTTLSEDVASRVKKGVMGQVGKLLIIVDERAPIIVQNLSNGSLTVYYRDVGDVDDRNSYANSGTQTVWDVNILLGRIALTETVSMAPRYDDDTFDIGKTEVIGMSTTYGMQATEYDADTETDSSRIGQNSGLILDYSGNLTN